MSGWGKSDGDLDDWCRPRPTRVYQSGSGYGLGHVSVFDGWKWAWGRGGGDIHEWRVCMGTLGIEDDEGFLDAGWGEEREIEYGNGCGGAPFDQEDAGGDEEGRGDDGDLWILGVRLFDALYMTAEEERRADAVKTLEGL